MQTSIISNHGTIQEVVIEFVLAPMRYPEILPTVLPIIVGAVVIELYFGKHTNEELGWNTSVGNAIIWVTTGATMLIGSDLTTQETYATFSLIGLGILVAYLNFFHKWSSTVAFMASSSGIVYTLAYIFVIIVETGMSINNTVMKGAGVFFIGVMAAFKIIQMFETPADDGIGSFQ